MLALIVNWTIPVWEESLDCVFAFECKLDYLLFNVNWTIRSIRGEKFRFCVCF